MAFNEAALKPSTSQETSSPDTLVPERLEGPAGEEAPGDILSGSKPINPEVSSLIRVVEQLVAEKKPRASRLHGLSTNPLVLVVVGFLLSGGIGTWLTFQYSRQQQELARQSSFSDELNKARIQKIGEVWERIDKNEILLDDLLDKANSSPGQNKERFDQISKLIDEDVEVISKNRFWLGEPAYHRLRDYLDVTGRYVTDMLLGPPEINLDEHRKRREQAKQDILEIRDMFLKGEPELTTQPTAAGPAKGLPSR